MSAIDFMAILKAERAAARAKRDAASDATTCSSKPSLPTSGQTLEHVGPAAVSQAVDVVPQFELPARRFKLGPAHHVNAPIEALHFIPNFISEDEEHLLWQCADAGKWTILRSRQLQMCGAAVDGSDSGMKLPQWLDSVVSALVEAGVFDATGRPNNCLINRYRPGEGIMPHSDGPCYLPRVATLR